MPKKERVIVYGFGAHSDMAKYNLCIGTVQAKNPDIFQVTVTFADGTTFTISERYCFITSQAPQYFEPEAFLIEFRDVTKFTQVVIGPDENKHIIATKRIPAGILLNTHSHRVKLTIEEINKIKNEYEKFVQDNLYALLGRRQTEPKIMFQQNYSPAIVFIGAVAAHVILKNPIIKSVMSYDPMLPKRLEDLWRRTNGSDLIWLEFWRRKLKIHTPKDVFHIWHMVNNLAWPSDDRLSLIFDETICFTRCHPLRWAEYEKVMAGAQNADNNKYPYQYLSDYIISPPERGDDVSVLFLNTIEAGETINKDFGIYVSNICDTVLNFLFMNENDGEQFLHLYKNIIRHFDEPIVNSFKEYLQGNLSRTILTRNANRTQGMDVCTTPTVHMLHASDPTGMPPALFTCYYCGKSMEHPKYCAICRITTYCNKKCQTADWRAGHNVYCMPRS